MRPGSGSHVAVRGDVTPRGGPPSAVPSRPSRAGRPSPGTPGRGPPRTRGATMVATLAAFLALIPAAGPPAALVLRVRGDVVIRPAGGETLAARPRSLLYAGDRLTVPEGAEA